MMLIQCFGRMNLGRCRAAQSGHIQVPLYAPRALAVECVATALHERGFARSAAQIAQLVVPCDALLTVLVDDVDLSLDVHGFGRGAVPHTAFALEASCIHIIPLQLVFPVDPRANVTHLAELVKRRRS